MKRIVAITGGIGAGKSVVCHVLKALGFHIYDCDTEARLLMDSDAAMRRRIADEVTCDALNPDGTLCRPKLAECVFTDPAKLRTLNSIVHGAVRRHFAKWAEAQAGNVIFVETAILYESGFDASVTEIWEVTAPREVRIARVEKRNGLDRAAIVQRIDAQNRERHAGHRIIVNDGLRPVIPQIMQLLENDPAGI